MTDPTALEFRRELTRMFAPIQVAWSADGRTVHLAAAIDAGMVVGGFAVVEDDGATVVIQVREVMIEEREGPTLEADVSMGMATTTANHASFRPRLRSLAVSGVVLGTLDADGFRPGGQVEPFGERATRPATDDEIALIAAGLVGDRPTFPLGSLRQAPDVAASLVSTGFSRHTFMCGQSGSGKTYTTGGLFERLLANTTLQIVILDPNSDHVHLGRLRDPGDTSPEAARFLAAAGHVRVARARGAGGDHILCADFSDLPVEAQALLLRLHPIDDADEFACLRRITGSFGGHYSVDDVLRAAEAAGDALSERLARRIVNLGLPGWDMWRRGDEPSLIRDGNLAEQRCVVLDIGSLARPEERTTVALALLGARWRNRAQRRPMLIAIDEAHNVLPAVTDDPLLRTTTELGILIAAEGRKFGLHLFVATQRPSKVHPNVVSQCDNLFLMRMNGAGDVHDLESLFSFVPPAMLHEALGFGLGQALVAGPISPTPMFVKVGPRLSPEGGADVPTTWATPAEGNG